MAYARRKSPVNLKIQRRNWKRQRAREGNKGVRLLTISRGSPCLLIGQPTDCGLQWNENRARGWPPWKDPNLIIPIAIWEFITALGILIPIYALFVVGLVFILAILLHFSIVISTFSTKHKELAQQFAILNWRVRQLEQKIQEGKRAKGQKGKEARGQEG